MNEGLLHTYFRAINAEDWDSLHGLWRGDASLRAVGARPRTGPDDIVTYYRTLFRPWKEHVDEPVRILPSGDAAAVEVVFTGLTLDGRRLSFDAVDIFDVDDDRIVKLSTWYDLVAVRAMLSAATGEPGRQ